MTRKAALLRGVNLGGRKLLMADLAAICTDLGYREPTTLLASGNVVLVTEDGASEVETALEAALARFGLATDVFVRGSAELEKVIDANPFPEAVEDHPSHVLVTFHREPFPPDALHRLRAFHDGAERLSVVGRELFIDFGGRKGMRASKLVTAMRRARFPAVATARNWNTVRKLAAMLRTEA
ncbi:DUF1697 domain-containing protein [Glacieibacterium frigidum]|uniref:DUF1697 domain-containing protein n=1 Tax=Glacieibacterium frigidum TaxID=2593303 RepID=A0A552U7Y9_9SPHN|nr:DUF1697 domain-containing protein [Glacieibacterium frigidum]TRW14330.1 DUF1697 domain-containing protein [Glacieibacterium frigidum]